mgnify:FL=1
MQNEYETKDMKAATTKSSVPSKDGEIWKEGSIWKFKWKGSECGYASESDAKKGLAKVSGTSKEED